MLLQLVRRLDQGPPEPRAPRVGDGAVGGLAARAAGGGDEAGVAAEPVTGGEALKGFDLGPDQQTGLVADSGDGLQEPRLRGHLYLPLDALAEPADPQVELVEPLDEQVDLEAGLFRQVESREPEPPLLPKQIGQMEGSRLVRSRSASFRASIESVLQRARVISFTWAGCAAST